MIQAHRAAMQILRNKEKEAREAICLKLKEKRELDKQGKPSIIHSIILYYFSNMNY